MTDNTSLDEQAKLKYPNVIFDSIKSEVDNFYDSVSNNPDQETLTLIKYVATWVLFWDKVEQYVALLMTLKKKKI